MGTTRSRTMLSWGLVVAMIGVVIFFAVVALNPPAQKRERITLISHENFDYNDLGRIVP